MSFRSVCLFGLLFASSKLIGQENTTNNSYRSFSALSTLSKFIFKDDEYNNISVPHFYIWELNISTKKHQNDRWVKHYNYPEIGFSFAYTNFKQQSLLGSMHSIIAYVSFPLFMRPKLFGSFFIGTGLAHIKNPYDLEKNKKNLAVSTHINNNTRFGLSTEYQFYKNWLITGRLSFNHLSVGMLSLPNWGLDIPGLSFGVKHKIGYLPKENSLKKDNFEQASFIKTNLAFALKESLHLNGPRYPIYIFSANVGKYLKEWNKVFVGVNITENKLIECFEDETDNEKKYALLKHNPTSIEVGDEILLNNLGFSGQVVYYLHYPHLKPAPLYTRLGLSYYLKKHLAYFAIMLKAHNARADYIEWALGFQIHKRKK